MGWKGHFGAERRFEFSVGWSVQGSIETELALQGVLSTLEDGPSVPLIDHIPLDPKSSMKY
jgi:hypothetical protein